jgi:hypothetical protein
MKTKTNKQKSCIVAIALAIFLCGGHVTAQSDPEQFGLLEMNNALISLDALMKVFETEIMYKAPGEVEEDVNVVLDRLEEYTAEMNNEIIYQAPVEIENTESFLDFNEAPEDNITDLGTRDQNSNEL